MKWETQIVHFPQDNERYIRRKNEEEVEQWYSTNNTRTDREERRKKFFHEETAVSALVIIKMKWELKEDEPYRPEEPKQSWEELSC